MTDIKHRAVAPPQRVPGGATVARQPEVVEIAAASAFMAELRLDLLWAFVAVAEELSFTRAAARLHLSQPGLSRRIAMLEKLCGLPLMARTTRRTKLTPAGAAFLAHARAVLQAAQAAESELKRLPPLLCVVPAGDVAPN
jgi:hypothetical protein